MDRSDKTRKTEALFYLWTGKYSELEFPEKMKGRFTDSGEKCSFRLEDSESFEMIRLRLARRKDNTDEKYIPLVNFLAEEKILVVLSGRHLPESNLYAVFDIAFDEEMGRFFELGKYSPGFLRMVLQRLRTSSARPEPCVEEKERPLLHKQEEIEAYVRLCGHALPAWVVDAIQRELFKLKGTSSSSDNRRHAQTALQYLANIDWEKKELHVPDMETVRKELDSAFYGLESVKTRILEIIVQIRRTGEMPIWGILLNGPAGTGKTSIAKMLAKLLNEPVINIDVSSLGDDPEELAGSPRIYGNGRPGLVLDKMFAARSGTGVLLINEIDKATDRGRQGAVGSADVLLTLLDGQGFFDNFLENAIPTDGLFAVATCNDINKLSRPLRDRFLVIDIPGYSPEEKEVIWGRYVLPRIMDRMKISPKQMSFTDEAVDEIVRSYAVEPGVRDLEQYAERFAAMICGMLESKGSKYSHTFTKEEVRKLLGASRQRRRSFAVNPGEINAMFYFQGSAHFFLMEASISTGKGEFRVLGAVPPLQREYLQVAYECVRNTTPVDFTRRDVTIFIPQPIPESTDNHVGCAAYAAICSLLLNTELEIGSIAFVGGVDLNGNLYFDGSDIAPMIKALKEERIKTVYAPIGVGALLADSEDKDYDFTVIETQNARDLLSIAISAHRL